MLDSFDGGARKLVKNLCHGRKRCVALMLVSEGREGESSPREPELEEAPAPEMAFSHQTAWVVAR